MNKFAIYPLKSGSQGNSYLITNQKTNILADCGISARELEKNLKNLGLSSGEISAAVITHEHTDHTKGIGTSARKHGFPVYATKETWRAMWRQVAPIEDSQIKIIASKEEFFINDIKICSYPTSHDAANPVGYSFLFENKKISLTTDTGYINSEIIAAAQGSDIAVIEANHDEKMLINGSYPQHLKERILSDCGHLSNKICGALCAKLVREGCLKQIMLGHLSSDNNTPHLAYSTVAKSIENLGIQVGSDVLLYVANRHSAGETLVDSK